VRIFHYGKNIPHRQDNILHPVSNVGDPQRILNIAIGTGCRVKVAQSIHGSLKNDVENNSLRDVDVADL
jgi:hypothetical protein